MKTRTIWTMLYNPFVMGGDVNTPIATEIGYQEEKDIGKGLKAFSFYTPKGVLRIAESATGAIVGDSFESVKADIKSSSIRIIRKQIKLAKVQASNAHKLSKEEFFKLYKH